MRKLKEEVIDFKPRRALLSAVCVIVVTWLLSFLMPTEDDVWFKGDAFSLFGDDFVFEEFEEVGKHGVVDACCDP